MRNGSSDIKLATTPLVMNNMEVVNIENYLTPSDNSINGSPISFVGVLFSISGGIPIENQSVSAATITEFSETTLILAQEYLEEQTSNGATTSFTICSEIVFTRI